MRISNVVIALSCVLLLTDCGQVQDPKKDPLSGWKKFYKNGPQGYRGDSLVLKPPGMETPPVVDEPKPVQEEPLKAPIVMKPTPKPLMTEAPVEPPMEEVAPPAPVVAAVPPPPPPPVPQLVIPPSAPSPELTWTQIDYYDAKNPALPAKTRPAPPPEPRVLAIPVAYEDVTVFPVDGDMKPYAVLQYDFTKPDGGCPSVENLAPETPRVTGKVEQQIFFGYGSAKVDAPARQGLKILAEKLADQEVVRLNVVGHASKRVDNVEDPIARKMINFKMAQKRANAVTSVLQQEGVKPDWVLAVSKGDEVPNPNPGTKSQEEADRRVDVFVDDRNTSPMAAW